MTSDSAEDGLDLAVVGGGNSAVEATLETWRAGARVTLAHFEDGLDAGGKPWIRPDMENRIFIENGKHHGGRIVQHLLRSGVPPGDRY